MPATTLKTISWRLKKSLPLQLNAGYEFKIKNPTIRYIGLWFSPGFSFDMDKNKDEYYYYDYYWDLYRHEKEKELFFTVSFSWELYMNMIFNNGMLLNIGFGGNKSKKKALKGEIDDYKYWKLDHTFLMFGTGVIF